jgi:hypothetical protein
MGLAKSLARVRTHRYVEVMPNSPKTPTRSIRIPDDEWQAALAATKANGETVTNVVRSALRKYVISALTIACFVAGGWLASSYFNPSPPTKVDYSKTVWQQRQQGHLVTPNPAPSPTTTHDSSQWEGI